MTQYMMSVYDADDVNYSPEEMETIYADVDVFNEKLQAAGAWVFGGGLHPADTATVVEMKDGEVLLTDGPYAESKEQIGGFWIIEAEDLDAAIRWAGEATAACRAKVEVRPFQEEPES
ncbi:MAG: YciI family protein [Acidimicrobiia bacterium]